MKTFLRIACVFQNVPHSLYSFSSLFAFDSSTNLVGYKFPPEPYMVVSIWEFHIHPSALINPPGCNLNLVESTSTFATLRKATDSFTFNGCRRRRSTNLMEVGPNAGSQRDANLMVISSTPCVWSSRRVSGRNLQSTYTDSLCLVYPKTSREGNWT